jgi:hypothetical protein
MFVLFLLGACGGVFVGAVVVFLLVPVLVPVVVE